MILLENITSLWAKKKSIDGNHYWLPLLAHLIDTKNTINWLFNHWLSNGQRKFLSQRLGEKEVIKIIKFLGFAHDIGKATPAFQVKKSFDGNQELDIKMLEKLVKSGFKDIDNLILLTPRSSPHAIASEAILDYYGVTKSISAIVGGHHGKPTGGPQYNQITTYTANYLQKDNCKTENNKKIQENWKNIHKFFLDYGLKLAGYEAATQIQEVNQPEAVLLEGLLIMADWLASSEYLDKNKEEPLFPLISLNETFRDLDLDFRFKNAITTWDQSGEWLPNNIDLAHDPYEERWGFKARPIQKIMTTAIEQVYDPSVLIIEAPMGLGKTELALLASEQLAFKTGQNGLFMGLPTQATTNAMFVRTEEWLTKLATLQDEKFAIKLMHGKAEFNQNYRAVPDASNVDSEAAVVINSWFSGKKSILNKFAVGTIDNLLLMGLKQKHLFLRHLGFTNKVVIIDEVHAYSSYMNQYLYKAIEWLGAYHVPLIILSATLPVKKRNQLLKSYYKGKYGKNFKKNIVAPKNWEQQQAYPLLTILDSKEIKQITHFPIENTDITKIRVKRIQVTDEQLIKTVSENISTGGIAGIIVNTVRRAQALAVMIPNDIKVMVVHSAFLAPDRELREQKLEKYIGKNAKRPEKMIVIGTQVLEQSLDIDFDVMYTDIAPIDLLLQRVGRLHRHKISRPQNLKEPQLFIMGIEEYGNYGDANEAIYEKYLLMKTDYFLEDYIHLPSDISQLVQKVYDLSNDEAMDELVLAKEVLNTNLEKQKRKAAAFQIASPNLNTSSMDDETTIHGWLDRSKSNLKEQEAEANVRDIEETLEVILIKHIDKEYYLINGKKLNDCSSLEIAQQIVRIPAVITSKYRITQAIKELEKQTIEHFSNWQDNYWLRGAIVLLVDKNNSAKLLDWLLNYSPILGLNYKKENRNE